MYAGKVKRYNLREKKKTTILSSADKDETTTTKTTKRTNTTKTRRATKRHSVLSAYGKIQTIREARSFEKLADMLIIMYNILRNETKLQFETGLCISMQSLKTNVRTCVADMLT